MKPIYWYSITDLPHREGSQLYITVSPGHYGRKISDINRSISLIENKLTEASISYIRPRLESGWILLEENGEPQVEIAKLPIDQGMMRTVIDAKTDAPRPVLEERLKNIGFIHGQPERY